MVLQFAIVSMRKKVLTKISVKKWKRNGERILTKLTRKSKKKWLKKLKLARKIRNNFSEFLLELEMPPLLEAFFFHKFCQLKRIYYFCTKSNKNQNVMKKVMLSVAVVAAFAFASCGGPSVCDCVKAQEEMMKEMDAAGDDEAKAKEVEEKFKSKQEECKKLGEGKSDDEKKKLMEEAAKCGK